MNVMQFAVSSHLNLDRIPTGDIVKYLVNFVTDG